MLDEKIVELNALDRCDRCGAQAYVRVTMNAGELLFCGHHYNKNKSEVDKQAVWVYNELDKLQ